MAMGIKRRFSSVISEIKEIRGEQAEEKVKEVLEELQREGIIKNFGQTSKFGIEDIKGIDFIVFWRSNQKILLQVKGYFDKKEQKRYKRRGIYVVLALPENGAGIVKRRILDIIERKQGFII